MDELYKFISNDIQKEDINVLVERISNAFRDAQRTVASHRKLAVSVQRAHEIAVDLHCEDLFTQVMIQCIKRVLPVGRREVAANRIVKFYDTYLSVIIHSNEEENDSEQEHTELGDQETVAVRFLENIINYLLQGVRAKDKNVRYRSCEFIFVSLNHIPALSDEMIVDIKLALGQRLMDKESSVRMRAALGLLRIHGSDVIEEDDDPERLQILRRGLDPEEEYQTIEQMVLESLTHDPSPEVRRAILLNLEWNRSTYSAILERARDVDSRTRRVLYSRRMKSMGGGDFRQLTIAERENLLDWGLNDRDPSVRAAATNMLCEEWMPAINEEIIVLLEKLDVAQSKVAVKVIQTLFNEKGQKLYDTLEFPDNFWSTLSAEKAFFVKEFNLYCRRMNRQLNGGRREEDPEFLPELKRLGATLEQYFLLLQSTDGDAETEFILEQVLYIAETYDLSDEMGRRTLMSVIRRFVSSMYLNDQIVERCAKLLRLLSVHERDFAELIRELVSDMADVAEGQENQTDLDSSEEEDLLHDGILQDESPVRKRRRASKTAPSEKQPADNGDWMFNIQRCLRLFKHALLLIKGPLEENPALVQLIEALVLRSTMEDDMETRILSMYCLGECTSMSKEMAHDHVPWLCQQTLIAIRDNLPRIVEVGIKSLVDILVMFGGEVLEGTDLTEKRVSKAISRCLQMGDIDDDGNLQQLAAEALGKIFLGGIIDDPQMIKLLVSEYFLSNGSKNEKVRQVLGFCLPVFCYSSMANKQKMAETVVASLTYMCKLFDQLDRGSDTIQPIQMLHQMLDWTDPQKLAGEASQITENEINPHVFLASQIVVKLQETDSISELKALCGGLSRLNLQTAVGQEAIELFEQLVDDLDELLQKNKFDSEALMKNSIKRFQGVLEKRIVAMKQDLVSVAAANADDPQAEPMVETKELEPDQRNESDVPVGDQSMADEP